MTCPDNGSGMQAHPAVAPLVLRLDGRDPLEVFDETSAALREATTGLTVAALCQPEPPDKWSVLQVIRHLADTELVLGVRYRMILAEDEPALPCYDQDAWASKLGYHEDGLDDVLGCFDAMRAANLRLLQRVTPEQWRRAGVHPERGPESLRLTASIYAGHDLYHLAQIERIKRANHWT